jgi:hypothetical protein
VLQDVAGLMYNSNSQKLTEHNFMSIQVLRRSGALSKVQIRKLDGIDPDAAKNSFATR